MQNGGHCQPAIYSNPPHIAAFELRNYANIDSTRKKHRIQCDFKALSSCHAYMTDELFAGAVAEVALLRTLAPDIAELVSVVTAESTDPSLEDLRVPNAKGAVLQKCAASLWPYKLVAGLLERLLELNSKASPSAFSFNLQTTTPATHLQHLPDGTWIVHTPRGQLATPEILLATNAYTSHLLPSFSDLIVPVRGQMSALLPPAAVSPRQNAPITAPLSLSYGFVGNGKQNINQDDYLIQRAFPNPSQHGGPTPQGELLFGGGRSYAPGAGIGISDDSALDAPTASYLRHELNRVLDVRNGGQALQATHEWSGIMGFSRDGRPWVGEVLGERGLWLCAGFTGHGMPNASLCAKAVVGLMTGMGAAEVD